MPVNNRTMPHLPDGRYVVVPDIQAPYHDKVLVALFTLFLKQYQPDGVLNVGDEIDMPQPSKWHQGQKLEFTDTLQGDIDRSFKIQKDMRDAVGYDVPFYIMNSNHVGVRWEQYLKKAPAISALRQLDIATCLGYDELGIEYLMHPYEFAPGWLLLHGHESGVSQIAGSTGARIADKTGMSTISGHTHRLGYQPKTRAANGKPNSVLHAIEAGNFMDLKKADYLKNIGGNWQHGFVLFEIRNRVVYPTVVPIINRTFMVEGTLYTPAMLKAK